MTPIPPHKFRKCDCPNQYCVYCGICTDGQNHAEEDSQEFIDWVNGTIPLTQRPRFLS